MDAAQALAAIARSFGARARRCDKERFPQYGFVSIASFRFGSRKVHGYATDSRVVFDIRLVEQELMFSVNRKTPLYPDVSEILHVGKIRVFLHSRDYGIDPKMVRRWIMNRKHQALLTALDLRKEENLHVDANGAWLTLKPDRDLRLALDRTERLLVALPLRQPTNPREGVGSLPRSLRPLSKYFAAWAVGDDAEREDRLRAAGKNRRDRLRAAVEPLLPKIDQYLASLEAGTESAAALNLGYLAEAVAEMRAADGL